MAATLYQPSRIERRLADGLRQRSVAAIEALGDRAVAASRLQLAVVGVESLLWEVEWPLDRAVRVAEALDVLDERDVDRILAG